ncbi:hypothetical protein [Candidatus Thiodiazotropha endoloripes]|nr:hypothetical protein [Candidatus Thiodiazotropha endoloripes]
MSVWLNVEAYRNHPAVVLSAMETKGLAKHARIPTQRPVKKP